ncbi:MAG: 2Fe-2S iron-sulfur cluster-binding protein [Phenylobacterium sp.]|jgi:2Fe-2S ferredoxin|uniref:2Fe-2S iron-sulfur cluster-binding protein n=1 Tax=Phenylobacterium sp. TaxID=1871053 RepID=UPI002A35E3C1|nr:2Fe-2S iron-sulfur cluster-binding protein [Phenylobacterium sp.]MDX9999519.1 2Fe-2S iron-sulfur cluster-binding protein [Phenylobacterium sp.]
MAKITYRTCSGEERTLDLPDGLSVMEGAVKHAIEGIDADCGGACACATCHVYVDEAWLDKLEPASDMERSMLDFAENTQPNSRLACQIKIKAEFDGLLVQTPESQH